MNQQRNLRRSKWRLLGLRKKGRVDPSCFVFLFSRLTSERITRPAYAEGPMFQTPPDPSFVWVRWQNRV